MLKLMAFNYNVMFNGYSQCLILGGNIFIVLIIDTKNKDAI